MARMSAIVGPSPGAGIPKGNGQRRCPQGQKAPAFVTKPTRARLVCILPRRHAVRMGAVCRRLSDVEELDAAGYRADPDGRDAHRHGPANPHRRAGRSRSRQTSARGSRRGRNQRQRSAAGIVADLQRGACGQGAARDRELSRGTAARRDQPRARRPSPAGHQARPQRPLSFARQCHRGRADGGRCVLLLEPGDLLPDRRIWRPHAHRAGDDPVDRHRSRPGARRSAQTRARRVVRCVCERCGATNRC